MNLMETFLWYLKNIGAYMFQMLPCMCLALAAYLLVQPARKRFLERKGLISSSWREGALLLFVMFSAGLAALTLFPANFWSQIMEYLLIPDARGNGFDPSDLYPTQEEITSWTEHFSNLDPFREIRRALQGNPWIFFMLLGNIGMFIPIGFFIALLWRNPRWWRSVLFGCAGSSFIEFTQFYIGRSTDVDDVILNTTGSFFGFLLFYLMQRLFPRFISNFQCHTKGESPEWTN